MPGTADVPLCLRSKSTLLLKTNEKYVAQAFASPVKLQPPPWPREITDLGLSASRLFALLVYLNTTEFSLLAALLFAMRLKQILVGTVASFDGDF